MPFYVPLGIRGLVLHLGGLTTRRFGALVYWVRTRRRPELAPVLVSRDS
ncbi:hypothetical protein ElP_10260 [Tautonia plasticadhaerens]|uniref:Uncharacterized protein n=1 Tax=Tautonia plasticadhaerens TaxID=2527974 RepID=A0A518GX63_9BACT|nr:hypothetical protein ElP_10260 [Tautonia plasticadhaerens]